MRLQPTLRTKKHLGQHLLIDPWVIQRIVDVIGICAHDAIIEIGPGAGAITDPMLAKAAQLCAIEVDREAVDILQRQYHDNAKFSLLHQSILKTDLSQTLNVTRRRVVGNLPYNLSSPIIFHVLHYAEHIQDAHIMVQKEVAERLVAPPGSKIYGRLSLGVQIRCHAEKLFDIGPEAFHPPPKVQSSIVRLIPKPIKDIGVDLKTFEQVVRQAFIHRRKKISNNLKALIDKEALISLGIDPNLRAEALGIDAYIALTQWVSA